MLLALNGRRRIVSAQSFDTAPRGRGGFGGGSQEGTFEVRAPRDVIFIIGRNQYVVLLLDFLIGRLGDESLVRRARGFGGGGFRVFSVQSLLNAYVELLRLTHFNCCW